MLFRKVLMCIVLLISCSCNIRSDVDYSKKISDIFYYQYNKDVNEITISLTKKENYMKSSFDELYVLYEKYGLVEVVTFEKGKDKFYPNTLRDAFHNRNLKAINGFENIDTSYVVDFSRCFYDCNCVDEKILDLIKFNNAVECTSMFSNCNSIISFDSSKYDFSNTCIIDSMFFGCSNLIKVDLSNSDFSNVTSMYLTFFECENLESIDFSNSDFTNCINVVSLFEQCTSLKEIDFTNSIFNSIREMSGMFHLCESLITVDLSDFDLSNVNSCVFYSTPDPYDIEDNVGMFRYCSNLKNVFFPLSLDFRTINNPFTFAYCYSLDTIYYKDGDNIEPIYLTKEHY